MRYSFLCGGQNLNQVRIPLIRMKLVDYIYYLLLIFMPQIYHNSKKIGNYKKKNSVKEFQVLTIF